MAHETVPADIAAAIDAVLLAQHEASKAVPHSAACINGCFARNAARAALDAVIIKHLLRTEALCELARNDADLIGIA